MTTKATLFDAGSLKKWTTLRPGRNLLQIAAEYVQMFALQSSLILFFEYATGWGIPTAVLVCIGVAGVLLSGVYLHRIALLGHESSHYLLVKNPKWNDLLADLLCFFPIWSNLSGYRKKHTGHHLHPNHPGLDPNLESKRAEELFESFPMSRSSSIYRYYGLFFWPPFVLAYLYDTIQTLVVGVRGSVRSPVGGQDSWTGRLRPGFLGLVYFVALFGLLHYCKQTGSPEILIQAPLLFYLFAGLGGVLLISGETFARSGGRLSYNKRLSAALRLSFGTILFVGSAWSREFLDFHFGFYYFCFWLVPLFYVFPYLMLLRELYQHANLGTGKLDNARIIHVDPFTRWALLPIGNDYHLIHHLYPNIPHYHLRGAHRELLEQSPDYRRGLIEVRGNLRSGTEMSSVSESLAQSQAPG